MDAPPRFVVTAWRNSRELLQLRQDIYSSETACRQRAVNKVFAWRYRKPDGLPLLLDSTADIVDVILQDERADLKHNALRLLYATAISRFVTGLADTQIELTRDRPAWFPPGKSLQLPYNLLEVRHRIVHRHLPSLAELKRAAKDSLDWLWEWYWSQLDHAFPSASSGINGKADLEPDTLVREKLQSILKTYVKERKTEIKNRKKDSHAAAEIALSSFTLRYGGNSTTSVSSSQARRILLHLLVEEKMILPADKKLGSTLSGAFLMWDVFFRVFTQHILSVRTLLTHLITAINSPSTSSMMVNPLLDPIKEGLYGWTLHLISSETWTYLVTSALLEDIFALLFSEPSNWNVRIAEQVLQERNDVPNESAWKAVLNAASKEDMDMDTDVEQNGNASTKRVQDEGPQEVKGKTQGPRKVVGLWKPKPWGYIPEGWEDDD